MEMFFFIVSQIKLIYTRKIVHLASFWKWGYLELRSGLLTFATLDTRRRLGQVNFRKDFWDCYWGQEKRKNGLVTIPEVFAKFNWV